MKYASSRITFILQTFSVLLLLILACGESQQESASEQPLHPPESIISEPAAPDATPAPAQTEAAAVTPAATPRTGVPTPSDPDASLEVWAQVFMRDPATSKIGYRVDLANTGPNPIQVVMTSIDTRAYVQMPEESEGGGDFGLRREIELAPGESTRLLGGDFPVQPGKPLAEIPDLIAGLEGKVNLEDAGGQAFSIPFEREVDLKQTSP